MVKVLIVDDDPDFVEITRLILRSAGYDTESASNGETALRLARESPPDVILLDVMMNGILDGVHVARELAEDPTLSDRPVVMVSSITDNSMSGMFPTDEYLPIDMWISKPVQPEDLLSKVGRLVQPRAT